ncbi:MAG: hypothetical protein A2Z18_06985 [Armatimonadetes bacterium RBG_16_58_9]|nr:MAG: hypothetical protein A2Z18_06985 [Armatimonadetes bacterium RBG_16_58_9]
MISPRIIDPIGRGIVCRPIPSMHYPKANSATEHVMGVTAVSIAPVHIEIPKDRQRQEDD